VSQGAQSQHHELTHEQQQARLSTGGVGFDESIRRGPAGGPTDDDPGEAMVSPSAFVDRELTDEEVIEIWETTIAGVSDGTIPTFTDKAALLEDVMRRLGR
jgi:hypothetical protein